MVVVNIFGEGLSKVAHLGPRRFSSRGFESDEPQKKKMYPHRGTTLFPLLCLFMSWGIFFVAFPLFSFCSLFPLALSFHLPFCTGLSQQVFPLLVYSHWVRLSRELG